MIQINNVSKTYFDGKLTAENHVSFSIKDGDWVSLVGKSGSGKSTLLNLIGALDRPDSGDILFDGKSLSSMSDDELARYRNENIGFVFQSFYLDEDDTVLANVVMPLLIRGVPKQEREERGLTLIQQMGLAEKANVKARDLSWYDDTLQRSPLPDDR